jgi:hypothetical protein
VFPFDHPPGGLWLGPPRIVPMMDSVVMTHRAKLRLS